MDQQVLLSLGGPQPIDMQQDQPHNHQTISKDEQKQVNTHQIPNQIDPHVKQRKKRKLRRKGRKKTNVKYRDNRRMQSSWNSNYLNKQPLMRINNMYGGSSKSKSSHKLVSKSLNKNPNKIQITVNLLGQSRRYCQNQAIDVKLIHAETTKNLNKYQSLKKEHQTSSRPETPTKLPKISSSSNRLHTQAIQTQLVSSNNDNPKQKIIDQMQEAIQNKRQNSGYLKLTDSNLQNQDQTIKNHIKKRNTPNKVPEHNEHPYSLEQYRDNPARNLSQKDLLISELQKVYNQIKFSECHYKLLKQLIQISTNQKHQNHKPKKKLKAKKDNNDNNNNNSNNNNNDVDPIPHKEIKQQLNKLRFLQSDIIYLQQSLIERSEVIDDIQDLLHDKIKYKTPLNLNNNDNSNSKVNHRHTSNSHFRNNNNITNITKISIIPIQQWHAEDKNDLKSYLDQYRESTITVIKQLILWRKGIEKIYDKLVNFQKKVIFEENNSGNLLLLIGKDIKHGNLVGDYHGKSTDNDPFLLSWIKNEKIDGQLYKSIRFGELLLIEEELKTQQNTNNDST